MTPLRATLRLQLHAGFTFEAAQAQLDYFSGLGISHLYLSPIAEAMPGSTHGYDAIDPTRISTTLGGEAAFVRLAEAARAQGMGIILDIVPNHLAANVRNPWWADVLKQGRRSPHAAWFDIEWDAPGCGGKLWLPVLDRPLGELLEAQALRVVAGPDGAELEYQEQRWPLSTMDVPAEAVAFQAWIDRCNQSPEHLARVLADQAYRLAWWRTGPDTVNYRRFFDINDLAAMRVERADVFQAMHALPLRLVREGWVDGLRIDHVDGLADPATYLQNLREALDEAGLTRGLPSGTLSLHVEKILAEGEALPDDWRCDGTTGYDFMDDVAALLHDPHGGPELDELWAQSAGAEDSFPCMQRRARSELLGSTLQADLDRCLRAVEHVFGAGALCGDITPRMLARATVALLRNFPVYRTYGMRSASDRRVLEEAALAASKELDAGDRVALRALCDALRQAPGTADDASAALPVRFEQLAAPLNAKAVEDTAFYRYGRLLSRNEVGSEPARLSLAAPEFLVRAQQRGKCYPRALLALATHDHKRGPDARMRLAYVSAQPSCWQRALSCWQAASVKLGQPVPLPGAETYMLWQTLLAAWPLQAAHVDAGFACRITAWLCKALREGKQLSRWSDPEEALEQAAAAWVDWLCTAPEAQMLRDEIQRVVDVIAPQAARLSLVQLALQLTCPGVPDVYQGNEGWDTSLVDPDNRRPVDYGQRRAWLADTRPWSELLRHWQDGAPKARLLATLLSLRKDQPQLFAEAGVEAIDTGVEDVLVIIRSWQQKVVLLAVQLRPAAKATLEVRPVSDDETRVLQLVNLPSGQYRNPLNQQTWEHHEASVNARTLFMDSPVALWVKDMEQQDDA